METSEAQQGPSKNTQGVAAQLSGCRVESEIGKLY